MLDADTGWAVGAGGLILHYSGEAWAIWPGSPTTSRLRGLSMASADSGWAGGDHGAIIQYAGGQWTLAATPLEVCPIAGHVTFHAAGERYNAAET